MVNKEALGDFYDELVEKHPAGRLGNPEEVAHAIVFLAENEFVTGINRLTDGGYTAGNHPWPGTITTQDVILYIQPPLELIFCRRFLLYKRSFKKTDSNIAI